METGYSLRHFWAKRFIDRFYSYLIAMIIGLKSWNSGALLLETALNKTKGTVGKNASEVIAAEKQAQNLTNQAKAINE